MNNQVGYLELEENTKSVKDYINMFRRRKRLIAIVASIVMTVMIITAFVWPPTYRAQSIILIEQQDIPSELVQTTITSYAQQRIEEIKTRIMTIGNIIDIVDRYKLYDEKERLRKTRTEIASEFRESVSIRPISAEVVDPRSGRPAVATIAFSLSYRGDSPAKVQKVTNEITTLYLNENLKDRADSAKSTSDFLSTEAEVLREELERMDAELAAFKLENEGALPDLYQVNRDIVLRSQEQLNAYEFQLKELQKRKLQLEAELILLSPYAPVVLPTGEAVLGEEDRKQALMTQLRAAQSKYTEDHPTVIKLKSEIESLGGINDIDKKELEKQLRIEEERLAGLRNSYAEEHPQVIQARRVVKDLRNSMLKLESEVSEKPANPDNPAYLTMQNQLNLTKEDMRLMKDQIKELKIKVEKHQGYLLRTPDVEKEYRRLLREQESTYIKFQEIRQKQMSADLAQNLESEQRGERFTLIQPPELPVDPVSPNRAALILLGAILALGAGVGAAILKELLQSGVYSVSDVINLTSAAPLVSIGYMETKDERVKHNRKRIIIVIALILLMVAAIWLFHTFVKPLDVTWYILMRKFGWV